ncbi:hypothetical protein AYR66_02420 [Noviherbaspirillum denitrificans]|uniref:Uncharacterized protein n=2 Tax=Noviherbaspirillum denitrificans TaxID=1968433 RepID=A0A254T6L4_9BURK|nr:hypothetical protein AYR66_02420 [Noviherbaspirillum denitrificans]
MTKFEIMALMMRKESQFEGDGVTIAAKLAACLEPLSGRMRDSDLAQLIQIGSAIYHVGAEQCEEIVPIEDLFPACESWPFPYPHRTGCRH